MTAGLIKANILVSDCISIHVNLTFPKYIHCSFIRWANLTGVRLHICCAFLKGPISISNGKAVISPGLFCGTQTEFEWCIIVVNIARWIHHNTLVCSGKHKMQGAKGRSTSKSSCCSYVRNVSKIFSRWDLAFRIVLNILNQYHMEKNVVMNQIFIHWKRNGEN